MTPTKEMILEKARELWHIDRSKTNDPAFDIEPELSELIEGGFVVAARSELMYSRETKNSEWLEKLNEELSKTQKDSTENFAKNGVPFDVKEALDTGFFICGTSQSGKTNLAKHLVKRLIDAGVLVYVFDPSQAWNHDSPITSITEVTKGQTMYEWLGSQILDISSLGIRERVIFVNEVCKNLYDNHVDGYRQKEFLIFEDAQTYLPNGCMRLSTRKQNLFDGVLDIVTVGANYGIRFGLITQFPAMVDKAPVKIAMQRYFGWTWEKNDVQYLKAFIGKDWSAKLQDLKRGQFIYQYRKDIELIQTEKFQEKAPNEAAWFNLKWGFACDAILA